MVNLTAEEALESEETLILCAQIVMVLLIYCGGFDCTVNLMETFVPVFGVVLDGVNELNGVVF